MNTEPTILAEALQAILCLALLSALTILAMCL